MSDVALFIIGFLITVVAFVGSLCYVYALLTGKCDFDRANSDDGSVAIDRLTR